MNKNKNAEEEEESSSSILIPSPCRILLPPHQYFREERETLCSCRGNLEGLKIHPVFEQSFQQVLESLNHRWVTCTAPLSHGWNWNEGPGNSPVGVPATEGHRLCPEQQKKSGLGWKNDIFPSGSFHLVME